MTEPLILVRGLEMHFPVYGGVFLKKIGSVKAVDNVTFDINQGETLGLVGESGCGKTTVGRCILRLIEPTAGEIRYHGKNLIQARGAQLRELRTKMAMIFQDPASSLNPRMSVASLISESLRYYKIARGQKLQERVLDLLEKIGLELRELYRYPHELSGGQKQRVAIARALALRPEFVVADEPVSALDVSIRAGILNLLKSLQHEFNLTYLFISHDISVIRYICERIIIMYAGKLFEFAEAEELFKNPLHTYTKALLSAVPIPDPTISKERLILEGSPPTLINPPSGCRLHPRCPNKSEHCSEKEPSLVEVRKGHFVACHLHT